MPRSEQKAPSSSTADSHARASRTASAVPDLLERRELVPPREDETAVATARAAAADVGLEQEHVERGLELLQADRSPETAVAAAADADVRARVPLQRRRVLLTGERLFEPEASLHGPCFTTRDTATGKPDAGRRSRTVRSGTGRAGSSARRRA